MLRNLADNPWLLLVLVALVGFFFTAVLAVLVLAVRGMSAPRGGMRPVRRRRGAAAGGADGGGGCGGGSSCGGGGGCGGGCGGS